MADSSIYADAKDEGMGGRVILWSDHYTNASGLISVKGGDQGGDGGLGEGVHEDGRRHSPADRCVADVRERRLYGDAGAADGPLCRRTPSIVRGIDEAGRSDLPLARGA